MKHELRMISMEEVPGTFRWERKKNARTAMISSMLLPGLGQVYNGRRIKTVIMVGLCTFYMGNIWIEHKNAQRRKITRDLFDPDTFEWRYEHLWYEFHKEQTRDFAWWSGAIWLIGVLDAYIDAHLYDIRLYKPPTEGRAGKTGYLTLGLEF